MNSPQRASAQAQLQTGGQPAEGPRQSGRRAVRFGRGGFRRIDHHQGHAADHAQQPQEEDHPAQRTAGRAAHRPGRRVRLGQARHAGHGSREPRAAPVRRSCSACPRRTSAASRWRRRGPRAGQDFSELARCTTAALGQDHRLLLVAGASDGHRHLGGRGEPGRGPGPDPLRSDPRLPGRAGHTRNAGPARVTGAWTPGRLRSWPRVSCPWRSWSCSRPVSPGSGSWSWPRTCTTCRTRRRGCWPSSWASALITRSSRRPPGSAGPDSLALAEYCGAALLAVEISVTRREDIEDSIQRISRLGAPVLGLVACPGFAWPRARPVSPCVRRSRARSGCASPSPATGRLTPAGAAPARAGPGRRG